MTRKKRPTFHVGRRVLVRALTDADDQNRHRWRLEYYPRGAGGKMRTVSLGPRGWWATAEEAEEAALDLVPTLDLDGEEDEEDSGELLTVEDLLQAWIAVVAREWRTRAISEATYQTKRRGVIRLLGPKRGEEGAPRLRYERLDTLDAEVLAEHIAQRQDEQDAITEQLGRQKQGRGTGRKQRGDAAPSTIRYDLGYLREAWRWAEDEGHVGRMPRFPKPPEHRRVYNDYTPTVAEARAVLDALTTPRQRGAYQLVWGTGARPEECATATVDLQRGTIQLKGKGQRHAGRRYGGQDRRFPLTPRALAGYRELVLANGRPFQRGERLFVTSTLRNALRERCEAAGVPVFTPYGLRRLAVDELRRAGVPLEIAAAITGHSVEVLLKLYRRPLPEEIAAELERAPVGGQVLSGPWSQSGEGS